MKERSWAMGLIGLCTLAFAGAASAAPIVVFLPGSDHQFLAAILDNRLPTENVHVPVGIGSLPVSADVTTGIGGPQYFHDTTVILEVGPPLPLLPQ